MEGKITALETLLFKEQWENYPFAKIEKKNIAEQVSLKQKD